MEIDVPCYKGKKEEVKSEKYSTNCCSLSMLLAKCCWDNVDRMQ